MGKISIRVFKREYFIFDFETKEERDLILKNRPYFMDSRGVYLNIWTPEFNLELDVPNDVKVWVRLPHLPLHLHGDEYVKAIGRGPKSSELTHQTLLRERKRCTTRKRRRKDYFRNFINLPIKF